MMATEKTISKTLKRMMDLSFGWILPDGYVKGHGDEAVALDEFKPNNYYNLMSCFADAKNAFEYFDQLAQIILTRPFHPLYCDKVLLTGLKNALGVNFIIKSQDEAVVRRVLMAKLLANINNGTITNTLEIYKVLMGADYTMRIRSGHSVSYTAVGGTIPLDLDNLNLLWDGAHTAGIYIELRRVKTPGFGFITLKNPKPAPGAKGFATLKNKGKKVLKTTAPGFAFITLKNPTPAEGTKGFSTLKSNTGGHLSTLVLETQGGGRFATILNGQSIQ
jgi:hypothetical protein